jgi:site-specific recombinase XerD
LTCPDRIEKSDITEYLTYLIQQGLTGKSRTRKLAAVREYFRYLVNHDLLIKSPAAGIDTPKQEKHTRDYLQRSEYNMFLSLAGGNVRDYAIFQVFLQSGVRVSELVNLGLTISISPPVSCTLSARDKQSGLSHWKRKHSKPSKTI